MAGRLLIADRGMLRELINETRQACEEALDGSDLHDAFVALRRASVIESSVRLLVHAVTPSMPSQEPVRSLLAELAAAGHTDSDAAVERCLLIQTARASLATLPALPVSESVKAMICDEVQSWTRLGQHEKAGFRVGTSRFVDLSLIASLRRFPAGQFDWVRSGLPLSYLLSVTRASCRALSSSRP